MAAALATALLLAPVASAIDKVNTKELRRGMTVAGIMEHEQAFQQIATANGGNRAATFPGYDASVEYVADRMRAAGFSVTARPVRLRPVGVRRRGDARADHPRPETWVEDMDYVVSQFSGGGDVTAPSSWPVTPRFRRPAGPARRVSGCDPADFTGMPDGAVALIQRGTCPFTQKYENARDAGAGAALIFNDGFPGREEPLFITAPRTWGSRRS